MRQTDTEKEAKAGASNRLVLASASPRRRMLLEAAGYAVKICPADVPEQQLHGEPPREFVNRLARQKAWAVAPAYPAMLVLGADTIVFHDGVILGKPQSLNDARTMLRTLSGATHQVLTGVCICRHEPHWEYTWTCTTAVTFKELDAQSIEEYLTRVYVLDKAGAYGIQEHGCLLVAAVDGLRSNVIGLPIEEVKDVLSNCHKG